MADFGELRSWVTDANPYAWNKLCAALAHWEHDQRFFDEILPYVTHHLARWPNDFMRWTPSNWIAEAIREGDNPLLAICNGLRSDHVGIDSEGVHILSKSKYVSSIEVLFLANQVLTPSAVDALVASRGWSSLRELDLRSTGLYRRNWSRLHKAHFMGTLERLWVDESKSDRPYWVKDDTHHYDDAAPNAQVLEQLKRRAAR